MRKRKTLASGCKQGRKKQKEKEGHIANTLKETDPNHMSGKETKMDMEKCVISSSNNLEDTKENDLDISLQATNIDSVVGQENYISDIADADPERKHEVVATLDMFKPEVKSTYLKKSRSAKQKQTSKSIGISLKGDITTSSLQVVQNHSSADGSSLLDAVVMKSERKNNCDKTVHTNPNPFVDKESGLSNSTDADIFKQGAVSPVINPNSNDAISTNSECKTYKKRIKKKSSNTMPVSSPSLPADEDCTTNRLSFSRIAEVRSSRNSNNKPHLDTNLLSSVEKENNALIDGACADFHKDVMLPEINPNSGNAEVCLNGHKETENIGEVFDLSQNSLEFDQNDSLAITSSLSETMELDLAEASVKDSSMLHITKEEIGLEKSVDDTAIDKINSPFEMAPKSHQVEAASQSKMVEENEAGKTLNCSTSCKIEHVLDDLPDKVLLADKCGIADNFDNPPAPEIVMLEKHIVHELGVSNDVLLKKNEVLLDGFDKTPQVSAVSAGKYIVHEHGVSNDVLLKENEALLDGFDKMPQVSVVSAAVLKVLSTGCREPPSPIRGVMNEPASMDSSDKKIDKKIARSESSKVEEVSFLFQISDKPLTEEPSSNNSDKTCASGSVVISESISLAIQKENTLNGMTGCAQREELKSDEKREVTTLSMSDTAANVMISDAIDMQDKKIEAASMPLERTLTSHRGKKLLVLDLNGLLADIFLDFRNTHKAVKKVAGKSVFKRPFCDDFLKFCFEKFDIGIWSSRKGYNVDSVVDFLLGDSKDRLLFCWDQSKCTFTGFRTLENVHKPLVLKVLKKLWNKEETDLPWEKGEYSPSNTLLVDDSPYKALCNPPHTAIFPHPYRFDDENDVSLGPGGDLRVYLQGLALADDVQHYVQEHQFGQHAITSTDPSWNFYLQVIDTVEKSSVPS